MNRLDVINKLRNLLDDLEKSDADQVVITNPYQDECISITWNPNSPDFTPGRDFVIETEWDYNE